MPACPENRSRYAGSRSPEAARPLRPPLSFEDAVQPVAEQVKAEDGRQDRQGRRRRRPELALEEVVGPGLDHVAPRGRGLLHAEAEIAQAGLDQNRLAHAEGGLDDQQGRAVMPQDVLENDHVGRQAQDMSRLDEILLAQKPDLARDQRRAHRDAGHAHDDHDVVDVRLERRDHEQDQHEGDDEQTVADIGQIQRVGVFPDGPIRRLADLARNLDIVLHSARPTRRPSFDARGLTATYTTRWSRLPTRTHAAASMAMPMITGKSRSWAACQAIRPMPGQLNTCSTMTAPPRMNGILAAMISVIGIKKPSLKACRQTDAPLARAVRM